jgi:hypothetical protein
VSTYIDKTSSQKGRTKDPPEHKTKGIGNNRHASKMAKEQAAHNAFEAILANDVTSPGQKVHRQVFVLRINDCSKKLQTALA